MPSGASMYVRFWGTRGSLPTPGRHTLRFGGNTSCVEVRTADTLVIIDCGSGLHNLGRALVQSGESALKGHILITHTHWDHIQGIPFFAPFFRPGNEWDIYAPKGLGQSLHDTLAGQMQYVYFPVRLDQMGAKIRYHELVEGDFHVGDVKVRTQYLNHTALTLGYRLEADGAVLVYATDHEPFSRHLASGKGPIHGQDRRHCEFLVGADLVIHDAQYTLSEYADKVGWGHSTVDYAVAMCREAKTARVALTHHDPARTDDAIEEILGGIRSEEANAAAKLDIFAAAEGQSLELQLTEGAIASEVPPISSMPALATPVILMAVKDPIAAGTIRTHFRIHDSPTTLWLPGRLAYGSMRAAPYSWDQTASAPCACWIIGRGRSTTTQSVCFTIWPRWLSWNFGSRKARRNDVRFGSLADIQHAD